MNNFWKRLINLIIIYLIIIIVFLSMGTNTSIVIDITKIFNVKTIYVLIMIVLPVICIIKLKTQKDSPAKIIDEGQLEKFNTTYNNIASKYKYRIENERKELKLRLIKTTSICLILFIFTLIVAFKVNETLGAILMLMDTMIYMKVFILDNDKYKKQYIKSYKSNIIEGFIKAVDTRLNYYPEEVRKADIQFPLNLDIKDIEITGMDSDIKEIIQSQTTLNKDKEYIDLINKNDKLRVVRYDDYICGMVDEDVNIKMANVVSETSGTRGLFEGILAVTKTDKSIISSIYIEKNKKQFLSKKDKVQLDSEGFEEMFDVYAEDRILATRILTSDIMQKIAEFYTKNKLEFQIYIKKDTIYLTFNTGLILEPKIFRNTLNKKNLYKYYNILEFVVEMTKVINKITKEIDI